MVRRLSIHGLTCALALVLLFVASAEAQDFVRGPLAPPAFNRHAPTSATDTVLAAHPVPGRIVVKYRSSVDACAHCLFDEGRSFASVTGSETLDRLNAQLGVREIKSLFFERHHENAAQARAAFSDRVDAVRARFPERSARAPLRSSVPDLTRTYELEIPADIDVEQAAQRYSADPDVEYANPVYEVHSDFVPDDPFFATTGSWGQSFADLWGLQMIDAATAWDTSTGQGTVIAIVDTGVDLGHPDLAANLWTNEGEIPANFIDDDGNGYVDDVFGWDFRNDDNDPSDRNGHGSHVAGTAAAVGNNAEGIVGAAWGARIMPVQGLGKQGVGFTSDLAQGVLYAAENGADVINNSWGGFGLSQELFDTIQAADALGAVVVSAAGNNGRALDGLLWLPAGHPDGLTVAALDPSGDLASFSSHGPILSVAAPGVDVLSVRAIHETFDSSLNVGKKYLRLSGTSMATPHVSGTAALVVAAQPSLTTAEVRWHVELGAEQPGVAGYETTLFNPVFGFGRLLASGALATPPVTTRIKPPTVVTWHAFPETRPVPGLAGSFLFTTIDPVAWSVTTPTWLTASNPAGSGPTTLPLSIDATGLAPATYAGEVAVVAPAAVDGGASFSAELHVHPDERLGLSTLIDDQARATLLGYRPATASNGLSTLVAWQRTGGLHFSLVRADGTATSPLPVGSTNPHNIQVGSDGHDFLIAWAEFPSYPKPAEVIAFVRVSAAGELLDPLPVQSFIRRARNGRFLTVVGVGYDGSSYWIAYVDDKFTGRGREKISVIRVRPDGSFGRPQRILVIPGSISAVFNCGQGRCMLAWIDWRVESIEPDTGKFIRSAFAIPVVNGRPAAAAPARVVTDMFGFSSLATDGQSYTGLSQRLLFCARGDLCRTEVIAVRIAADGTPIDPDAIVVSNVPASERAFPWPGGISFDGTDWAASYQIRAVDDSPFDDGSYLFVNQIDAAGTPLSTEYVGTLVDSSGRASQSVVAATATDSVVVWEDGSSETLDPSDIFAHPQFTDHRAQRMLPHDLSSDYPDLEIGAIGTLTVAEGDLLRFRLRASGLDPLSISFSAVGLPPGASFDPTTALFQWRPTGEQAGSYPGASFTAVSATGTLSEDVSFTVTEAVSTLSGVVLSNEGAPLAGILLAVRGTVDRRSSVVTGADGSYHIEGLLSGRKVKLRLGKTARRSYRSSPRTLQVSATGGDLVAPDLLVSAK